jgi:hypothetical protein
MKINGIPKQALEYKPIRSKRSRMPEEAMDRPNTCTSKEFKMMKMKPILHS